MGTRVKKIIGYGIKNLKVKSIPCDPRWDYKKYLGDWCDPENESRDQRLSTFLVWCQQNRDLLILLGEAEYGCREKAEQGFDMMVGCLRGRGDVDWAAPYSALTWSSEFGMRNVLMFVPAEHSREWVRRGDIIDFYEEVETQRPRAVSLQGSTGIYPYDDLMKRFQPPTPEVSCVLAKKQAQMQTLSRDPMGDDVSFLSKGVYKQVVGSWQRVFEDPAVLKHFKEDWRPVVPFGVLAIIEYLGCFPDAHEPCGIVNSLRPMIYTYWS